MFVFIILLINNNIKYTLQNKVRIMNTNSVAIIGAGQMGTGIAQVFATFGFNVYIHV